MFVYDFYLRGEKIGTVESKEQIAGNDLTALKVIFGNINDSIYSNIVINTNSHY